MGVHIDKHLKWNYHIEYVRKKICSRLYVISKLKNVLPKKVLRTLYYSIFGSHNTYGLTVCGSCQKGILKSIIIEQKKVHRIIDRRNYNYPSEMLFNSLNIMSVDKLYKLNVIKLMYQLINNDVPSVLNKVFDFNMEVHPNNTRSNTVPHLYVSKSTLLCKAFLMNQDIGLIYL